MYFNYNEYISFFDEIKGCKDILDDINQFNSNVKAIKLSESYLPNQRGFVEQEVTKCLVNTENKYRVYISIFNLMQLNISPAAAAVTLDKISFEEKVRILMLQTERIPAYVCLREHLDDKFKQIFLRLVNIAVDDNTIEKARRSII